MHNPFGPQYGGPMPPLALLICWQILSVIASTAKCGVVRSGRVQSVDSRTKGPNPAMMEAVVARKRYRGDGRHGNGRHGNSQSAARDVNG